MSKYKIEYFFKYTLWTPFRCVKNFFFCLRYPFYKVYHRWTGKFSGYSSTEYDAIPCGWRKAFGKQLSEELRKTLKEEKKRVYKEKHKKVKTKDLIYFSDIKEKYGTLRLYASATEALLNVLHKYENLSANYCINCGRPAEYETEGWIEYLCGECFLDTLDSTQFKDNAELLDYMKECEIHTENED